MSKLKVRDLMTTQVVTLKPDDTVKKAVIKFALDNISGAPVVDNRNHLLGILSENDVLAMLLKYQDELDEDSPGNVMLNYPMDSGMEESSILKSMRTVLTTTPDTTIMEVLSSMLEMKVNRLPVVEKGVVVGIISRGDIIFALYKRKA